MQKSITIDYVGSYKNEGLFFEMTGHFNQPLEHGVQPSQVSWVCTLEDCKHLTHGDIVLVNSPIAQSLFPLHREKHNPNELLGSDHNGGMLYFGSKEDIGKIEKRLNRALEEFALEISNYIKEDGYDQDCELAVARWDFSDGNTLVMVYIFPDYVENLLQDIRAPGIVTMVFGSDADDLSVVELLKPYVQPLIKGVQKEENIETGFAWVNDEDLGLQHDELIIPLSYHVWCSLLQWHQASGHVDSYYQDNGFIDLAQDLNNYYGQSNSKRIKP